MAKLFNSIRKKLVSEKPSTARTANYLKYAIGEIALVVIGILIALTLNNSNDQRKSNLKVEAILEDVLEELTTNIENADDFIRSQFVKDSIIRLVLNDKLTYDDYANPSSNRELFFVTSNYAKVELNILAYNNLSLHIDAIPSRYDNIIKRLTKLHTKYKNKVDLFNEAVSDMVGNNLKERSKKFKWYSLQGPIRKNEGMIKYMLDDYIYKNKVKDYQIIGLGNQVRHTASYRNLAIDISRELAILLNKSNPNKF